MLKYLLPWAVLAASSSAAMAECGNIDDACQVDGGEYLIALPEGDIKGSIVFLHDFGGSGKGSVGQSWVKDGLARGYAVIGPDGLKRETGNQPRAWSFHPDWRQQRDEVAFLTSVRDDAASRFDLDADSMALGGF